jgi:hypothetical protein
MQASNEILNALGCRVVLRSTDLLPVLDIFLPGLEHHRSIVIEVPEHAWYRTAPSARQTWIVEQSPGTRPLAPFTWETHSTWAGCTVVLSSGFSIGVIIAVDDRSVDITYKLISTLPMAIYEARISTCVKLYRPFMDIFLERTFIHGTMGIDLLAAETPTRLNMNAEEWLPCRYIASSFPSSPLPSTARVSEEEHAVHYFRQGPADASFIATEATCSKWVAASYARTPSYIWTNPARTCHHLDWGVSLSETGIGEISQRLYILRGTAQDVWDLIRSTDSAIAARSALPS